MNYDFRTRRAAFDWLAKQIKLHGEVLPRALLQKGFEFSGKRVPLVSPQGIFTPREMDYPLSITTVPNGPYEDTFRDGDFIWYKYRGTDPQHRDNVGLRNAMKATVPLIYFLGIVPGKYLVAWPVYVIADHPGLLQFKVVVDEVLTIAEDATAVKEADPPDYLTGREQTVRRAYATREIRTRLHQSTFREKVLAAYREQCALCKLRHKELLDAAHIIPDSMEHGHATVDNGISLCKLHHAAFDRFLIGITPDFKVRIRQQILEEEDGPMLQHGLKELHGRSIILPADRKAWPNRDFLDQRYSEFTASV